MSKTMKMKKTNNKKSNKVNQTKKKAYLEINEEIFELFKDETDNATENNEETSTEQQTISEQLFDEVPNSLKDATKQEMERLEKLQQDLSKFGKKKDYDPNEELPVMQTIADVADTILQDKKQSKKAKRNEKRAAMNLPPKVSEKESKKIEKEKIKQQKINNETEEQRAQRIKKEQKKSAKQRVRQAMEVEMAERQDDRWDILDNFGKKELKNTKTDRDKKKETKKKKEYNTLNKSNIDALTKLVETHKDNQYYLALKTIKDRYEQIVEANGKIDQPLFEIIVLPLSKFFITMVNSDSTVKFPQLIKTIASILSIHDLEVETMTANMNDGSDKLPEHIEVNENNEQIVEVNENNEQIVEVEYKDCSESQLVKVNLDGINLLLENLKDERYKLALETIKTKYENMMEEKDNITEKHFDSILEPLSKLISVLLCHQSTVDYLEILKSIAKLLLINDLFAESMEASLKDMPEVKESAKCKTRLIEFHKCVKSILNIC